MRFSALKAAQATHGTLARGLNGTIFLGVSTDSRAIRPGELFVPLVGKHCDGHDFITDALQRGAAGFLFQRDPSPKFPFPARGLGHQIAAIRVHDTLRALGDLAAWMMREHDVPVIAITGSNGKTTTKELIAHLLAQRFRTHATPGNLNTEVGLPLTILNAPQQTELLVLEMGTTVRGDVQKLCEIARPSIGILTSISEEHTATLGSLEEIIAAEAELIEALPAEGLAIVNGDTPEMLEAVRVRARCPLVTFGFSLQNNFVAENVKISRGGAHFLLKSPAGQMDIELSLLGRPAVLAALAAAAVAQNLGLSLEEVRRGLADAQGAWGRLQLLQVGNITVLNDAYNANPASMREAILCAAQIREPDEELIFVLGDMLELGSISERAHREIGRLIAEARPTRLIVVSSWAQLIGDEAPGVRVQRFSMPEEAADALAPELLESDQRRLVLLKGSRGMRLEKIMEALQRQRS